MQVFLRVDRESGADDLDSDSETKTDVKTTLIPQSDGLARRHFGAMMTKRLKYFKRDCQSWCCQLILPLVLLILGILLYKVGEMTYCFNFVYRIISILSSSTLFTFSILSQQ